MVLKTSFIDPTQVYYEHVPTHYIHYTKPINTMVTPKIWLRGLWGPSPFSLLAKHSAALILCTNVTVAFPPAAPTWIGG